MTAIQLSEIVSGPDNAASCGPELVPAVCPQFGNKSHDILSPISSSEPQQRLAFCYRLLLLSPSRQQTGTRPETFTLDNGLNVIVIPDHRTPVVTQMIWYKVGSADETPGKSGLAHFLEHLMFKGTEAHPAGEFSGVIARIGGNENAFTSTDYTAYFQRVPARPARPP